MPSSVSGRVLSSSGQAIAGASVQIGTASTQSASDGSYAITGLAATNYSVTVSASGYTTFHSTLSVPASSQLVEPFTLTPAPPPSSGALPTVTSVTTQYSPNGEALYFLGGVPFNVTFIASVNWGVHPPGTVRFITPNNGVYPVNANGGNMASQTIDVGRAFGPGGKLQVQAVSSDGAVSVATDAKNMVVMSKLPYQDAFMFAPKVQGSSFYYQSVLG